MLDAQKRREIDVEAARIEMQDSSWKNYDQLAILYTLCDHERLDDIHALLESLVDNQHNEQPKRSREYASEPIPPGDSEFLQAASAKDSESVWHIIDELMETLKVVNVKAYNRVMRKINEL